MDSLIWKGVEASKIVLWVKAFAIKTEYLILIPRAYMVVGEKTPQMSTDVLMCAIGYMHVHTHTHKYNK